MDPVTHLLFGANMSRAGLNRRTGLATLTLIGAAEFPDTDVFLNFFSRVEGFAHHRGFTHTLLGVPVMAAIVLGLVYAIYRLMLARGRPPKLLPRWGLLYCYALLGGLSHILLDFTNNYGVRPFSPFHHRWYAWDIVAIIEPLVTGPLLLALIAPWLFGLVNREIGERKRPFPGRRWAIAAFIVIAVTWWARDWQHRKAVALLENETYLGAQPLRVSANPYDTNPFAWHGVVETETFFQLVEVDTLKGAVDPLRTARTLYKPEETPQTLAAKQSRLGQVYLDWARHPYVELRPHPDGSATVLIRDLRYAYPHIRRIILGVTLEVDRSGRVVEQLMGWPPPD